MNHSPSPIRRMIVLGAGAGGIVAAIAAAERSNIRVTLLERNSRIGKKLLATGNGRCNLDHLPICPDCYTSASRTLRNRALDAVNRADPLNWFHNHGLVTRTDGEGRVYPYSNQAADVVNLLLDWLERTGVEVCTERTVTDVIPQKDGVQVLTQEGEIFYGDGVICAMGGQAGAKFGCDGFSSVLAGRLGIRVEPEYPCLTPLTCEKSRIRGLSGIRVKAAVTLTDGNHVLGQEEGEVQFTDYGLSGIAVMQLSNLIKPGRGQPVVHLNLFPQWSEQDLTALLRQRVRLLRQGDCGIFMTGLVSPRIGASVWKTAGLGHRDISTLQERDLAALAHGFQDWTFPSIAPHGWQQAQTTGGGISLREVDLTTFALNQYPNVYVIGEALDCAGACGGYNLHWAFGTALCAAGSLRMRSNPKQRGSGRIPSHR